MAINSKLPKFRERFQKIDDAYQAIDNKSSELTHLKGHISDALSEFTRASSPGFITHEKHTLAETSSRIFDELEPQFWKEHSRLEREQKDRTLQEKKDEREERQLNHLKWQTIAAIGAVVVTLLGLIYTIYQGQALEQRVNGLEELSKEKEVDPVVPPDLAPQKPGSTQKSSN